MLLRGTTKPWLNGQVLPMRGSFAVVNTRLQVERHGPPATLGRCADGKNTQAAPEGGLLDRASLETLVGVCGSAQTEQP